MKHRLAANSMQVKIDEEHRLQAIGPRKGVLGANAFIEQFRSRRNLSNWK